jgi:hypothetical protein
MYSNVFKSKFNYMIHIYNMKLRKYTPFAHQFVVVVLPRRYVLESTKKKLREKRRSRVSDEWNQLPLNMKSKKKNECDIRRFSTCDWQRRQNLSPIHFFFSRTSQLSVACLFHPGYFFIFGFHVYKLQNVCKKRNLRLQ